MSSLTVNLLGEPVTIYRVQKEKVNYSIFHYQTWSPTSSEKQNKLLLAMLATEPDLNSFQSEEGSEISDENIFLTSTAAAMDTDIVYLHESFSEVDNSVWQPQSDDSMSESTQYDCKNNQQSFIQSRIRTQRRKKPYRCNICMKTYMYKGSMENHMTIHKQSNKDGDKETVAMKQTHKRRPDYKRYYCMHCNKSCRGQRNLETHLLTHCLKKAHQCEQCAMNFNQDWQLQEHLMTVHIAKQSYQCKQCGQNFKDNQQLQDHHSNKRYHCNECGSRLEQKKEMEFHTMLHTMAHYQNLPIIKHTAEKPFRCTLCEESFSQQMDLYAHILTHDRKKQFERQQCAESFNNGSVKDIHLRSHDLDVSNEITPISNSDMQIDHSISQPLELYQCLYCEKSFHQESQLDLHTTTHTKSQNSEPTFKFNNKDLYHCNYCEVSSSILPVMKMHMKTHIGDYQCNLCGKEFLEKSELQIHTEVHVGRSDHCQIATKIDFRKRMETCVMQQHEQEPCSTSSNYLGIPEVLISSFTNQDHCITGSQISSRACQETEQVNRDMHTNNSEMLYQCQRCAKQFMFKQSLIRHLMFECESVTTAICHQNTQVIGPSPFSVEENIAYIHDPIEGEQMAIITEQNCTLQ
uniref:Zinc finger protein 271-like n=1 Tax=Saccoglossus kowalevskii TaxID=10224 RepID=A0ABM0MA37_SACKO